MPCVRERETNKSTSKELYLFWEGLYKEYNTSLFFWLCWVFVAVCRLSLAAVNGGYSLVVVSRSYSSCRVRASHRGGFSWCLLLQSTGSRVCGLNSYVWCMGSLASQHVGSTSTSDQIHVTCIGRQILNHWPTRKVQWRFFSAFCLHTWGATE